MGSVSALLYVEDNLDDFDLFALAWRKVARGHRLLHASNGLEACDLMRGLHRYSDRATWPLPKVILSDIAMPFMDGIQFLEWLRSQKDCAGLPFFLCHLDANDPRTRSPLAFKAEGLLTKPSNGDWQQNALALFSALESA